MKNITQQKEEMRKVKLSKKELSQIVGGRFLNVNPPKPESEEPIILH